MNLRFRNYCTSLVFLLATISCFGGCRLWQQKNLAEADLPQETQVPAGRPLNPLPVPMLDRELVMDEISDAIDDYFAILTEQRIADVDGLLSEGWIETRPKVGGSIFEPWKRDSTPGFEKLHATLQSVRRFAKVRVIPTAENYLVDLRVYKELEDLSQPVGSTVSGRTIRSDNALDIDLEEIFEVSNRAGFHKAGTFLWKKSYCETLRLGFWKLFAQLNNNVALIMPISGKIGSCNWGIH